MSGSIKIIIGSMFSGKSTEMIRIVNRFGFLNIPVLAISHSLDNRYDTGKIVTHNQQKYDCHSTNTLMPFIETDIFKNCQVVAIEEAQFFPDLFEFVTKCADEFGKKVIVAGLDGNFKREPFGDILKLIPYSESVTKLHALCTKCGDGTKASFTKRIIESDKEVLIGSGEHYIPVCRKHYLE